MIHCELPFIADTQFQAPRIDIVSIQFLQQQLHHPCDIAEVFLTATLPKIDQLVQDDVFRRTEPGGVFSFTGDPDCSVTFRA